MAEVRKVIKGGSWDNYSASSQAYKRCGWRVSASYGMGGFRVIIKPKKVIKGGSWSSHPILCQHFIRRSLRFGQRTPFIGFRLSSNTMPNSLIEIPMVEIPEGTFMMGRRQDQLVYSNDELPLHEVTLRGFYMSRYLITQAQWRVVATNLPKVDIDLKPSPSRFKGDHKPVEKVSWYEAVEFCNRLTLYTGDSYSLPSESQWEYACRAGTETNFHFGNEAKPDLLNYFMADTEEAGTTIVGSYPPNPFGLYDMHGNVWEWCLDDWHSDYFEAPTDGSPRLNESDKALLRGGSWYSPSRVNRSGFRNHMIRKEVSGTTGFRITHEQ